MNTWGEKIKISIFGESHGAAVGIVLDGIPSGVELDLEEIKREMQRRAPGRNSISTPRAEADEVKILSGFFDGKTTGTPLAGMILNTNTISKHYQKELGRPGHADYTGFMRYGMSHDYRGGGHFSGRLTAPLVFAGAVAKQVVAAYGVTVGAHILRIGEFWDTAFDAVQVDAEQLRTLWQKEFPVLDWQTGDKMQREIVRQRDQLNSIGGIVECAVVGMPPGLGAPFFGSVESRISSMMFSVPAVKGIEFGAGFGFAEMTGKEANDEFYMKDGCVKTYTNHNAGINGGITNGMPVVFKAVVKPTASIAQKQRTVDIEKMKDAEIEVHGRHDPCITHRAAVVIEAATALVMLDLLLDNGAEGIR